MAKLDENFVSDDGYSTAAEPTAAAGGSVKKRRGDLNIKVDPTADTLPGAKAAITDDEDERKTVEVHEEVTEIAPEVAALFEGMELDEDFKKRAGLIFEAAVSEAAAVRAEEAVEAVREELEGQLEASLEEALASVIENLDAYLEYAAETWMEENRLAVEAGIRVEMAESLIESLKQVFYEHNIEVDEDTADIVGDLEDKLAEADERTNQAINEAIELTRELAELRAEKVFSEVAEGLTVSQSERLRVLSEKLDPRDIESFKSDLETLSEAFFAADKRADKSVLSEETAGDADKPVLFEEKTYANAIEAMAADIAARAKRT